MLGFMVSIWGCKEEGKKNKRNICCLVAVSTLSTKVTRDIEEQKKEMGRGGWGRWRITISQCALVLNNNNDDDNNNLYIITKS